ncbi:MAG: pentapeptide repeat-containing protein [Candidatus Caenarcaniphilales bacterium]|nr:pentapeptide repeat-containing protein [Candidatus Caenarcaniphilales bacterium]
MIGVKNYQSLYDEYEFNNKVDINKLKKVAKKIEALTGDKVGKYVYNKLDLNPVKSAEVNKNLQSPQANKVINYFPAKAYLNIHEQIQNLRKGNCVSKEDFFYEFDHDNSLNKKQLNTILDLINKKANEAIKMINALITLNISDTIQTGSIDGKINDHKEALIDKLEEDRLIDLISSDLYLNEINQKHTDKNEEYLHDIKKLNAPLDSETDLDRLQFILNFKKIYHRLIILMNPNSEETQHNTDEELRNIYEKAEKDIGFTGSSYILGDLASKETGLRDFLLSRTALYHILDKHKQAFADKKISSTDEFKNLIKDTVKNYKYCEEVLTFLSSPTNKIVNSQAKLDKFQPRTMILLTQIEELIPKELIELSRSRYGVNEYINQTPLNEFNHRLENIEHIREAFNGMNDYDINTLLSFLPTLQSSAIEKILNYDPNSYTKPSKNILESGLKTFQKFKNNFFGDIVDANWKNGIYKPLSLQKISLLSPQETKIQKPKIQLLEGEETTLASKLVQESFSPYGRVINTNLNHLFNNQNLSKQIQGNFTGRDFSSGEFHNKLVGVHINEASLCDAKFDNEDLSGSVFENINAKNASFKNILLNDGNFKNVDLTRADFSGAKLSNVTFENCILDKSTWEKAKLHNIEMINCVFQNSEINEIDIDDWRLENTIVNNLKLLAKAEGINITKLGLIDSIFTNFIIADKDSIKLNEKKQIENRDSLTGNRINIQGEAFSSTVIGYDPNEKLKLIYSGLSEWRNTSMKYPIKYFINKHGNESVNIIENIYHKQFGNLGTYDLAETLKTSNIGIKKNHL